MHPVCCWLVKSMGSCCDTSWGKLHSHGPAVIFLLNLTFTTFSLQQTGWEGWLWRRVSASLSSRAELSQDWRQPAFKSKSCKETPFLSVFWRLLGLRRVLGSPLMAVRAKSGHPSPSGPSSSLHREHAKDDSGQKVADAEVALKMFQRKRMHLAFQGSWCFHTLQN